MAFDAFLKIEGIEGSSQQKGIRARSRSRPSAGARRSPATSVKAAAVVPGKVQMQDFHFTMNSTKASPVLMRSCATGEHIKEATLTCRKAGGSQQDFLIIKMNDVIISSYSVGGASDDGEVSDQLSLAFVKIDYVFRETNEKGEVVGIARPLAEPRRSGVPGGAPVSRRDISTPAAVARRESTAPRLAAACRHPGGEGGQARRTTPTRR